MGSELLGLFEQTVLLGIIDAGPEAFGLRVMECVEERAGKEVAVGALFGTLKRLEAKGLVHSRQGDATPQRGGRPRRFFRVTTEGRAALRETKSATARVWHNAKIGRTA